MKFPGIALLAALLLLKVVIPTDAGAADSSAPESGYPGIAVFPAPRTTRYDNDVFETTGYIRLSGDRARAEALIADVSGWREWMLRGMDGPRDDGKRLLVYLVGLDWKPDDVHADDARCVGPSGTLGISAILPLMKAFGADPSVYPFAVEIERADTGSLSRVVARFTGESVVLEEAEYVIAFDEAEPAGDTAADGFVIRYEARVKIHAFFDFFFSLRSYRRTIGWYLDRIARNFADAWKLPG